MSSYTVCIEKIVPGGAGMGRINGKAVFVPRTLPGEEVRARLIREKKDYAEAEPEEILRASPLRRMPACPLFGECGGCDFLHTDYAAQKDIKKEMARDVFKRIGRFDIGGITFEESAPFGYRSRVRLHRVAEGGSAGGNNSENPPPFWGFKKSGGAEVLPVQNCLVASTEINAFLTGKTKGPDADFSGGGRLTVFGYKGRAAFLPDDEIRLALCGKEIVFSPKCFFQSNIPLLEKLAGAAFAGLSGDYALDLYGGVGTFGVFLGENFRRVVSVEENPASAAFARRNLPTDAARSFQGTVEEWIASETRGSGQRKTPDLIVVDPPRAGLSAPVRDYLKKAGSPLVLYVSCDAASLARDSRFLLENGYSLAEYRLFDFYPQTAHVESLCRFTRN